VKVAAAGLIAIACAPGAICAGQPCEPGWSDQFPHGTISEAVRVVRTLDVGGGPELFVGGAIETASGFEVNNITRWNGTYWEPLGAGLPAEFNGNASTVYTMTAFDDGSGPALYAAGLFGEVGGPDSYNVARWDGSEWWPLGEGRPSTLRTLVVHDDGSGPALYASGHPFDAQPILSRWDGQEWQVVVWRVSKGNGYPGEVRALASFDDGTGPALYAAGRFSTVGDVPALGIARLRLGSWSPVGEGLADGTFETDALVAALQVFDDGDGPRLYAGGDFGRSGEAPARRVARWTGQVWEEVGGGLADKTYVSALAPYDEGQGERLFATANLQVQYGSLLRLDEQGWTAVGESTLGPMFSIAAAEGRLFVGGSSMRIEGSRSPSVAIWDGKAWSDTYPSISSITASELFDDGSGEALYASVPGCDGCPEGAVRRWDGAAWEAVSGPNLKSVEDFLIAEDASGRALYAAGRWEAGGLVYPCVRWDGLDWSPVGNATGESGFALCIHDLGQGPQLYLSGGDSNYDSGILRLEGGKWYPLPASPSKAQAPRCLASFDDGNGPALYAGMPNADGKPLGPFVKWDGEHWLTVPTQDIGIGKLRVKAMQVFDDGQGPRLFVGGSFSTGRPIIAQWDGTQWSKVGGGIGNTPKGSSVGALTSGTFGGRPTLVVAGSFDSVQGLTADGVALWDGQAWSVLDSGIRGHASGAHLYGDDDLILTGSIVGAGEYPSSGIAHWTFCPPPCPADCDLSGSLNLLDYLCFSALFDAADAGADCDGSGVLDLFDFLCFVNAFNGGCP
jgi:hypothetical protein